MEPVEIARLLERTARAVYDVRGPGAIHAGQWAILRFLVRAGQQDSTIGGIAQHLGVTHAPASRAVAALLRRQLVVARSNAGDRRVRQIELTARGRDMLAHDPVLRLADSIASLDAESRRSLQLTLQKLHDALAAQADRPPEADASGPGSAK